MDCIDTLEPLIEKVSNHDPECTKVEVPSYRCCDPPNNAVTNDELIRLVVALRENPAVRKIDFYHARRSTELFQQLAALFLVNTVVHYVQLPYRTSNDELLLITASLQHRHSTTTLTTLDLWDCDIRGRRGGDIVRRLLLSNGTITEVIMSYNCELGAEGVASIAQALQNHRCVLKKLNLYQCGIGNEGARELSTALGNNNNNVLEELDIAENGITFTGVRHVLEMLETNSSLQVLSLARNWLDRGRTGHEIVGDLVARALRHNTSLHELNVSACALSAADLSLVFPTLVRDNKTLSRLNVRGSRMDDASTNSFARSLPEMKGLQEIEFTLYDGVPATVLRGFLEGLRNNKSLICIRTDYDHSLRGEGSYMLWLTWLKFVTRRNKMLPILEGNGGDAAPQNLWPCLLKWCHDGGCPGCWEAEASLVHRVLCSRANDVFASPAPKTNSG